MAGTDPSADVAFDHGHWGPWYDKPWGLGDHHDQDFAEDSRQGRFATTAGFQSPQRAPQYDRHLPEGYEASVSDWVKDGTRWVRKLYVEVNTPGGDWVGHLDANYRDGGWGSGYRDGPQDAAHITDVWVHPKHQRKGIATGMLKIMREMAAPLPVAHNIELSDDGRAWAQTVGATAARDVATKSFGLDVECAVLERKFWLGRPGNGP